MRVTLIQILTEIGILAVILAFVALGSPAHRLSGLGIEWWCWVGHSFTEFVCLEGFS
jgi:hypothetical protein